MKIKSYIYCFVALALVGCDKGETQSQEATEESVEVQFSMGTKSESGETLTYRFLATIYTAGTNTDTDYQVSASYRDPIDSDDDSDSTYLIPCELNDNGTVIANGGSDYDSSYGLYPNWYSLGYSLTAVTPGKAATYQDIYLTESSSAISVFGMKINREVETGSEVYIATIPTISFDGPTMGGADVFAYTWPTDLKEPRATLTLTAKAETDDYYIKSITYRNVADKAQFHPKSGFVVDHSWYDIDGEHVFFTSTNASDDLDIEMGSEAVTIPYKVGSADSEPETMFYLLAHDYSVASDYISAPELVVVFNIYENGVITGSREAVVTLNRSFSYQTNYTMELTLKSLVLSVSVSATSTWDEVSNSSSVGGDDEFWKASVDLSDGDWDSPAGGDITGTIN